MHLYVISKDQELYQKKARILKSEPKESKYISFIDCSQVTELYTKNFTWIVKRL